MSQAEDQEQMIKTILLSLKPNQCLFREGDVATVGMIDTVEWVGAPPWRIGSKIIDPITRVKLTIRLHPTLWHTVFFDDGAVEEPVMRRVLAAYEQRIINVEMNMKGD